MADELVLRQEDETQIRQSIHPVAQLSVVWTIFSRWSWLEATPTEGLTEAVSYARLSSFAEWCYFYLVHWWKSIRISHDENSHNNQLEAYSSVATKKNHIGAKCYLCTRINVQSLADGVSKFDYIGLMLLDPGVKVNEICYCSLLPPQLLPVVASSVTVPQCTRRHASFLTLIFHKVM